MDVQSANKQFRRNVRGFYLWIGSLIAAGALPVVGLKLIDTDTLAGRIIGAAISSCGWVPMTLVVVAIIRAGDEFQRRLHLVALGFAFAGAMLLISVVASLVRAGFITYPDLMLIWTALAVIWLICLFAVKGYYERAGSDA
jgi:hypothetical protein